ncbi:hypothetical protein BHE74_00057398 [Ensete ventricosum]|nr:hypothetical protein GW17_00041995 [Ensete ventricosum]RWW37474.1 hypothetical protein BHE74_00057398 [Ensete ventricosum]RZR84563.1 hypothetical protein BHM03_00011416 [Ensete ventricosum]
MTTSALRETRVTSATTSASACNLYATSSAQKIILTVGGPAEQDSENRREQHPVQNRTHRPAKGTATIKHLGTTSSAL